MKKNRLIAALAAWLLAATLQAQTFYVCHEGNTETTTELTLTNGGTTLNGTWQTNGVDSITMHVPALHFVGADISLLPTYEAQKATYMDVDGRAIDDVILFLKQQGMNCMRVRLFVDPSNDSDKAVVQDLDYVKALGVRIKQAGLLLMLDFHYSDTWADPGKQWTPKDWASLSNDELYTHIYEYTRDCLQAMNEAGASPDFIQTGNEISYGMLWGTQAAAKNNNNNRCYTNSPDANWTRFTTLLKRAGQACREVCPRAQIILHSERVPDTGVLTDFFDRMKKAEIDYDVIGLSYYPYYHGRLSQLESALTALENKHYGKPIQVVECGYPSKWAAAGTTFDYTATYPYSHEGQRQFTADLIATLKKHPLVMGLSWWYAEANAKGCTGSMATDWYNASLFDNQTGHALPALYELQNFK